MSDQRNDSHSDAPNVEWTPAERALLASLPREDALPPNEGNDIVAALRARGSLGTNHVRRVMLQLAAAVTLMVVSGYAGMRIAQRGSLERELVRTDLSASEHVMLLQRAGSAYVSAAQSYADATKKNDSAAVQVASQVLIGAASAVARTHLDGGISSRLTSVLASAESRTQSTLHWY